MYNMCVCVRACVCVCVCAYIYAHTHTHTLCVCVCVCVCVREVLHNDRQMHARTNKHVRTCTQIHTSCVRIKMTSFWCCTLASGDCITVSTVYTCVCACVCAWMCVCVCVCVCVCTGVCTKAKGDMLYNIHWCTQYYEMQIFTCRYDVISLHVHVHSRARARSRNAHAGMSTLTWPVSFSLRPDDLGE